MSEFEDRMREALQGDPPADESFVQRIDAQIGRHEQRRAIGLGLAAAAALALIAVLAVGLGIATRDALARFGLPALAVEPFRILRFAAPAAGLLFLAALAYPLIRLRK
jgi:hypothetical protein